MPKIIYDDTAHTYMNTVTGDYYTPVSTFFKKFMESFDAEFSSIRSAIREQNEAAYKRVSKIYGYDNREIIDILLKEVDADLAMQRAAELRAEWGDKGKTGRDTGTDFHKLQEMSDYALGTKVNRFTDKVFKTKKLSKRGHDNISLKDDLFKLTDGYYPELIIFNDEYQICGTADMVFIETKGKNRLVWIDDWKTDKTIEKTGFFNKKYGSKKFAPPINHLQDCNYNEYMMKISIYAWMLEQFGFTVAGIAFTHADIKDTQEVTWYPMPYKKFEVEMILNF